MSHKHIAIAGFVAALILSSAVAASAGTTGVLSGHIFDGYGRPLRGATVELITLREPFELSKALDPRTHEFQTRTTSASGFFVFISLYPGVYVIRPTAPGMYFFCPPRVAVFADQTSYIQLFMLDHYILDRCQADPLYGPG